MARPNNKWQNAINVQNKLSFEGIPVLSVKHPKACILAINKLLALRPVCVGFDMEWKPNKKNRAYDHPTALIQIGHEKLIILIQIHLFKLKIPKELISFLSNSNIIKCGVGISGDAQKLFKDYGFKMYGIVDLNDINLLREPKSNMWGLAKTSKKILNRNMKYKNKINHSKWENSTLSAKHIKYACDDAITAYWIFKTIINTQYHPNENIMDICFNNKYRCNVKEYQSSQFQQNKPYHRNNMTLNKSSNRNMRENNPNEPTLKRRDTPTYDHDSNGFNIRRSQQGYDKYANNVYGNLNRNIRRNTRGWNGTTLMRRDTPTYNTNEFNLNNYTSDGDVCNRPDYDSHYTNKGYNNHYNQDNYRWYPERNNNNGYNHYNNGSNVHTNYSNNYHNYNYGNNNDRRGTQGDYYTTNGGYNNFDANYNAHNSEFHGHNGYANYNHNAQWEPSYGYNNQYRENAPDWNGK